MSIAELRANRVFSEFFKLVVKSGCLFRTAVSAGNAEHRMAATQNVATRSHDRHSTKRTGRCTRARVSVDRIGTPTQFYAFLGQFTKHNCARTKTGICSSDRHPIRARIFRRRLSSVDSSGNTANASTDLLLPVCIDQHSTSLTIHMVRIYSTLGHRVVIICTLDSTAHVHASCAHCY